MPRTRTTPSGVLGTSRFLGQIRGLGNFRLLGGPDPNSEPSKDEAEPQLAHEEVNRVRGRCASNPRRLGGVDAEPAGRWRIPNSVRRHGWIPTPQRPKVDIKRTFDIHDDLLRSIRVFRVLHRGSLQSTSYRSGGSPYGRGGRTRLYWTLFGGNHHFFRTQEAEDAKVPRLSIEYDPNGTQDLYVSQAELIPTPPQAPAGVFYGVDGAGVPAPFRLIRQSLRVVVGNAGPVAAERCTAELKIIETSSPAARRPSAEPKGLLWETSQDTHQDIAALVGHAVLNVMFSDTRLSTERQPTETTPLYALVATPDSIRMIPSGIIRAQDGFGRGEFVAELTVVARNGSHLTAKFRIRVTDDWRQLSMDKIS